MSSEKNSVKTLQKCTRKKMSGLVGLTITLTTTEASIEKPIGINKKPTLTEKNCAVRANGSSH